MNSSVTPASHERSRRSGIAVWRWARWVLPTALLASAVPSTALATPEYPGVIDGALQLPDPCPRPLSRCLICHTTARGGQRTAEQLFAITLRDYGFTRGNEGTALQNALAMLPEDTDSDGDGEPDKEELERCGNPSGEDLGIGPEYGCDGAHLARELPSNAPLMLIALGVAGMIVRRRRGSATRA